VTTVLAIVYISAVSVYKIITDDEIVSIVPYLGIIFPNVMLSRFFEETNAKESKCK